MTNKILWMTYNGHHVYKIYSDLMRSEYYLYKDDIKIKTAENPEIFNDYIQKQEKKENK